MKTDSTTKGLSGQALEPLIKYCAANRGTTTEIVHKLTVMTGQTQYRQNVEEWLHPEPERRVEPRLGIGLALLIIGAGYCGSITIRRDGLVTAIIPGVHVRRPIPTHRRKPASTARKPRGKNTAKGT